MSSRTRASRSRTQCLQRERRLRRRTGSPASPKVSMARSTSRSSRSRPSSGPPTLPAFVSRANVCTTVIAIDRIVSTEQPPQLLPRARPRGSDATVPRRTRSPSLHAPGPVGRRRRAFGLGPRSRPRCAPSTSVDRARCWRRPDCRIGPLRRLRADRPRPWFEPRSWWSPVTTLAAPDRSRRSRAEVVRPRRSPSATLPGTPATTVRARPAIGSARPRPRFGLYFRSHGRRPNVDDA